MKTIYKTLIVVAIIFGLMITGYISYKTTALNYLESYLEVKRLKLELAKPEKVDSLLNIIESQDSILLVKNNYIDIVNSYFDSIIVEKDNEILDLKVKNNTMTSTISTQTKMLRDFLDKK